MQQEVVVQLHLPEMAVDDSTAWFDALGQRLKAQGVNVEIKPMAIPFGKGFSVRPNQLTAVVLGGSPALIEIAGGDDAAETFLVGVVTSVQSVLDRPKSPPLVAGAQSHLPSIPVPVLAGAR